ncbi:hypothetical protein FOCC_FOCC014513 [Frankliniella occidentalis]|nr:hypothetical protein FOCC_FOCC014513 [Frankliniella occidentalis]
MAASISSDSCEISLHATTGSSSSMDFLRNADTSNNIPFSDMLDYDGCGYSLSTKVSPKYGNEQMQSYVSIIPGKYDLNTSVPENYFNLEKSVLINGNQSIETSGTLCSEAQDVSNFSTVMGHHFQENYNDHSSNNHCEDNNYQLAELTSKQSNFSGTDGSPETFLEVTDGGRVVAVCPVIISRNNEFYCSECKSTFPDRFSVISHLMSHVEIKLFRCIACDLLSSSEAEARLHFESHISGGVMPGFINKINLNSNKKEHNFSKAEVHSTVKNSSIKSGKRERKWICKICQKAFCSSKALHEHDVVHTGARDFPCNICGKAFGTAANMRIHLATHSDQRPYVCLTCNASFRQKDSLKVHIRKHTGERPFVCSVCKMAFDRSFTLKNHMMKHAEKSFVCSVCGKSFSTRGGLFNHERLHFKDPTLPKKERQPRAKSGTGDWICDECGKIYSSRSNLKIHKKTHEQIQVCHVCPVCSQSYKSRDSMEVHMRRHTEERPYKCTMCSRSFFRNYTLKIHILTHTGEKPQKCPIEGCSKSFAQRSSLSFHVKNHKRKEERSLNPGNGKRPYRKRQAAVDAANGNVSVNSITNIKDYESSDVPKIGGTEALKFGPEALMSQNIAENIVDPGVQSMLDDISNNISHQIELPSVWGDNEGVSMLGVVNGLHHTSQHMSLNDQSIVTDLQQQHCQQTSLMQYVSSETLPMLVGVPDTMIYHHDSVHKMVSGQPPHLP